MIKSKNIMFVLLPVFALMMGCGNASSSQTCAQPEEKSQVEVPVFNADSAYQYVARQMAFGNRIPNTESHEQTAKWLAEELRRHGAQVTVQQADVTAYDGTTLHANNIIGSYNLASDDRILLMAHWDSRPFADHDSDKANYHNPVPGANDGASGVGVLLEIARALNTRLPNKGLDILFVDAEDYGRPEFAASTSAPDNSWALGTQYWARRPHQPGYRARYSILLDMVGAHNATFLKEGFSKQYAPSLVDKIWTTARNLGYSNYFIEQDGGFITDDHYYINTMARIPAVDIIHLDPSSDTGFYPYWHTVEDDLDKIDPSTLKAVGETVLNVIFND